MQPHDIYPPSPSSPQEHQDYLSKNPKGYCNHRIRFQTWPWGLCALEVLRIKRRASKCCKCLEWWPHRETNIYINNNFAVTWLFTNSRTTNIWNGKRKDSVWNGTKIWCAPPLLFTRIQRRRKKNWTASFFSSKSPTTLNYIYFK